MSARPLRYLFVCTANINRSPTAATWADKYLTDRFVFAEIKSAGTHAWDGNPAGAYSIDAMRELGFDMREHRSQPATAELLEWADHVVVMEPMHEEFLRPAMPEGKTMLRLWDYMEGTDHVVDPHGGPLEAHQQAAALIGTAIELMVSEHLAARRAARSDA